MIFGEGGEEWQRMGVAVGMRVGSSDMPAPLEEAPPDLSEDDLLEP